MTDNNEDFEPVGVDLDVAAFLRDTPGRRSFLRRGQSHFNPPHSPAPQIHKADVPSKTDQTMQGLAIVLIVVLLILIGMFYAVMFGFGSGLP